MNVTRKCIYLQTWYSDRNDHTTMTAPLTVLSKKLSIVGHCLYYNWGKHWNPECYYFGCLLVLTNTTGDGNRTKQSLRNLLGL